MQALAFGGIALFLPLIRDDLGLSFTQAGALSAVSTLVYAFMQIPAGYLADRFGARRLFVVGLLGTNVLTLMLAVLDQFTFILANQALSGFFRALVFAPGLLLVTAYFPPERRATAMGLYVAGGFSSSILLNLFGPLLVEPLGWRGLFALFAVGGLIIVGLFWRFGPDVPRSASGEHATVREALGLFRIPQMWMLAGIQYARLAIALGIAFWLPAYIVEDKGFSLRTAGLMLAVGALVTAPSNFFGGYLADRIHNPLLVIGVSQVMLAITLALLVYADDAVTLLLIVAANALFVQLYFGPLFAVPIEMLGPRLAGVSSGFGNFFANIGGFTSVYAIGALKDATGSFTLGFHILAAVAVLGAACTVTLGRIGHSAHAAAG
jgi:nitrate/nitrite transporter NarK